MSLSDSSVWIVVRRELLKRLRSKWFLSMTFLGPILFLAVGAIPAGIMFWAESSQDPREVVVVDRSGLVYERLTGELGGSNYRLSVAEAGEDSLRARVLREEIDGYFVIPEGILREEGEVRFFTRSGTGLAESVNLRESFQSVVREVRFDQMGVPDSVRASLDPSIPVSVVRLSEEGAEEASTGFYTVFGFVLGFLVYMMVMMYGAMVMQGVSEEKKNRVVEIVVSSIRPFELMMGKIVGIGVAGLLQVVVWMALLGGALSFAGLLVYPFVEVPDIEASGMDLASPQAQQAVLEAAGFAIPEISPLIFVYAVSFAVLGYLFYATMFAAVGAAMEDETEGQGLRIGIMMPLILTVFLINFVVQQPDSGVSVVASLIPLFSPVLMVVRIGVSTVPWWQVVVSLVLLIGSFVGGAWVAGKIYRVGILMQGSDASLRDLVRWFRYG